MEDRAQEPRQTYITRINIKRSARDGLREIAHQDRVPVSTFIGMVLEDYVTARSTS